MLRRLLVLLLLITCGSVSAQSPTAGPQYKTCREHQQLSGKCFTVRGRLAVYNGAPALRLWRVGTRRMLGVSQQRFAIEGYRNIPEDIEKQVNQGVNVFGDFTVCPFTRPQPGEMQLVCIEAVRNLVVRKR
jgi:hypothetical protein